MLQQPAVSETRKGIRRTLGTAQHIKTPLLTADVRRMVDGLPENIAGCRDRSLLLGFAGGFRRSELAALDVEDVLPTEAGLVVKLRRSKTDPEAREGTWPSRMGPVGDVSGVGAHCLEDRHKYLRRYLNGAGELAIMCQTGHRSLAIVHRYIRDGPLFRENPAAKLGL